MSAAKPNRDGNPEHSVVPSRTDRLTPEVPARSKSADFAVLGDVIYCQMKTQRMTLSAVLCTPESVSYGNHLIATGRWKILAKAGS